MRSLADSPLSSGTHSPSPDRTPMTEVLPAIGDCSIDSTATRFHPEPAVIGPITATLIQASIAASTRRAYRGALERLDAWLDGRVLDDHALSEWIAVLHDRGLSVSSASLAVGAARFRARMAGLEDPAGPLTLRTLAGIRRSSIGRGRGQVGGVTWEEADLVVDRAMGEGTVRGLRDAALIAVGSDALLRVSEMVAINTDDIVRYPDGSAILHVRRSKADQEGEGATCYLGRRTVEVLDAWMAAAGIGQDGNGPDDPVFRSVRKGGGAGGRLSCRSARSIVIRRCGGGNSDNGGAGRISGHSLRVGSAISLARAGASLVELQQAGRWKSPEMPARYTRGETARRGPVARLRHGQEGERRREAGDCPDAGGISGRPGADTAQDIEQEPDPDDGLTPGIRFNGARAGSSVVPIEACEQARPCSPVSSPDIGEPASGGLIGTYKQEGPMSNRRPGREVRVFPSFRHACLPWGLGASLVPLDRMNRTNERKRTMKQKPDAIHPSGRAEKIRAALAAVFLSLLLAACGGGNGGNTMMPEDSGGGNTGSDAGSGGGDSGNDGGNSGGSNGGNTAGTRGGSGGTTSGPPRYTVTCNNCRNDLTVNIQGLSYEDYSDELWNDGRLNLGNLIADALNDSTYGGITTHVLGTTPQFQENDNSDEDFGEWVWMETAGLADGPMSWGTWISDKFDYTYNSLVQNQIGIHDGPTWAGRNLAELTGRATYKGTARGHTEGGDSTFFALAELTAEFGDSTDNGTISGRISTAELLDWDFYGASEDEPATDLTLGAIPLTSDANGITGKTGTVTGHLYNCIGGCPTPEPGNPETDSAIGVTDVAGSWGGVFRGTTGDGVPEGITGAYNATSADGEKWVVGSFGAINELKESLREKAVGASERLAALNSFTALADRIRNHQDYLDFDQALHEHIESGEVLTADDIEYLTEHAELKISLIYPDASQENVFSERLDVPEYSDQGASHFNGFDTFFNLPADTDFSGIRRTFSSDIKLDFANSNTTINPNGSSVTKVYAETEFFEDEHGEPVVIEGASVKFHYTREGQNRIVTFTLDDTNEDGDYEIPAGTAKRGPPYDEDSPYDIESWGWWQQTGFRGSQERWPYVSVLGLWVGDATTSAQRNYVITGPATLPADMPTAGSARFRGDFYALAHRKNAAHYNNPHRQRIAGDVEIIFEFDDGTASGSITNIRGRAPGLPWTSVSNFDQWSNSSFTITNGTISGNTFQATLTGVDTSNSPDVASVRGFTGDIDGGFFGPPEIYEMMIGAGVTASRDLDGTDNDLNLHGYIVGQE